MVLDQSFPRQEEECRHEAGEDGHKDGKARDRNSGQEACAHRGCDYRAKEGEVLFERVERYGDEEAAKARQGEGERLWPRTRETQGDPDDEED